MTAVTFRSGRRSSRTSVRSTNVAPVEQLRRINFVKEDDMDAVRTAMDQYTQWMIGATKPRALVLPKRSFGEHPERSYSLKSKAIRRYLQHEHQTWGINLGWTDNATNATGERVARWFFLRKGTSDAPIRYGETIALGNGGSPSFVRYEQREWGINLGYSDTPVFEWRLLGGAPGTPVHTQEWIAIFNEKSEGGECLIYFDRNVGANIGWPSSVRWEDKLKDLPKSITKDLWDKAKKQAMNLLLEKGASAL